MAAGTQARQAARRLGRKLLHAWAEGVGGVQTGPRSQAFGSRRGRRRAVSVFLGAGSLLVAQSFEILRVELGVLISSAVMTRTGAQTLTKWANLLG